ncbi:MAG: preprotein translocase subunit YajC [Bacteroidota bacterium]
MNLFVFLQASGGDQSPISPLILMAVLILVFYLFMIRPQVKKQKELKKYREQLQKGDKVVTTGGIYGKVDGINDKHVLVDVDNDIKLRIDKNAILKDPGDLENKR